MRSLAVSLLIPFAVSAAPIKKAVPPKAPQCPIAETTSIGKFGVHQDGISGLPPTELTAFKALAARIGHSFDAGCTPVSEVELTGHADRDRDRGPAFELDISKRRASALRDGLVKELGAQKAARVTFKVNGVGATQLKIKSPVNETQRKENRRVVIATRLGKGGQPAPPNQCLDRGGRKGIRQNENGPCLPVPQDPRPVPGLASFFEMDQVYNGEPSRFWFPAGTKAGVRLPLVIYLQGRVTGAKKPHTDAEIPQNQMMATKDEMKTDVAIGWNFGMNMGKLSELLVKNSMVKAHIVAAPAETVANRKSSSTLWKDFPLARYVNNVDGSLAKIGGPRVDFDRVIVAGWSGAGCADGNGLRKIASEGGRFNPGDRNHDVFLLGLADVAANEKGAGKVAGPLKSAGNNTTIIYSLHQGVGGCSDGTEDDGTKYLNALGATRALTVKDKRGNVTFTAEPGSTNENADKPGFDVYRNDGNPSPTRLGARIANTKAGLRKHVGEFANEDAVFDGITGRDPHGLVPLVWAFYALPRFLR